MKFTYILACLFCCLSLSLQAQTVNVNEDYSISRMMERFSELNRMDDGVEGWRIQLVATTDRRKMEVDKEEFMQKYPQISIDWTHAKPYYRLRAGAFKTKLEATKVLYMLKKDYPSAFPAQDPNINPQELINQ